MCKKESISACGTRDERRSISLKNDVQEVVRLALFVEGVCSDLHLDDAATAGVNLAVEEAVANVINYAYPEGTCGDIVVTAWREDPPLEDPPLAPPCEGGGKGKSSRVQEFKGSKVEGEGLVFEIRDTGRPFDPTAVGDPDLTRDADERDLGGLGIFLMRQYMSDVRYERRNNENILRLIYTPDEYNYHNPRQ